MEVGNLWLIPVSIFLNSFLYWIQKHYLVKWFCRQFLSKSVQLECDLKTKRDSANGVVANGQPCNVRQVYDSSKEITKKLVTDGEVSGVSMENVGSLIAAITALVSAIVMMQTRHDVLNARSSILIPWCHIAAWYFVVDLYNMYDAFRTKNDISHLPCHQRYTAFVRTKWPYVVHHVVLFTFGYQVVVLGQDKTAVYIFNGYLLVFVFFVVRILNIPFVLLVYAAQCHSWNIVSALRQLRLVCYVAIILQYILQLYWFVLIVKLALRSLAKISHKPGTPREMDEKKTQ